MSLLRFTEKSRRAGQRAFTLVELMVAITGGLFVSIIVFTMAKNSARFYQSETRVGEATLGAMVGFDRLRADIARAGFLASPNLQSDLRACGRPPAAGFPPLLNQLTSIQVTPGATDTIVLAGSYSSVDHFPMRVFMPTGGGGGPSIILNPYSQAMQRLGADPTTTPDANTRWDILTTVFKPGRVVRIVDRSDRHYYAVITAVLTNAPDFAPEIQLALNPPIQLQGSALFCGIDQCTGCVANVVNFIRYDVAKLDGGNYGPLYDAGAAPFDDSRTELRRVELDPTTLEKLEGTEEELVAQYAVDLKVGLLVQAETQGIRTLDFGNDEIPNFAGPPPANAQRIRGVRVRLGVRTRDADREADLDPEAQGLPPGLYRVQLGDKAFARVRTLQADVMLNNQTSLSW